MFDFDIDNSIINNNFFCPDFKLEKQDPNDDNLEDLNLSESYGMRIKFDSRISN